MAEEIITVTGDKETIYNGLLPQIKALVGDEKNQTANLANVCAALKSTFDFFWVGFYLVDGDDLVLGPFQGPVACTRIKHGQGVCGSAWERRKTIVVPDVDKFPGHIACSSLSKSEVVVPIIKGGQVVGVLDVDSKELDQFDKIDAEKLEEICQWLATVL